MTCNLVVFEDAGYRNLLPLTWLRPACALRCGRDTLLDKIRAHLPGRLVRMLTRQALQGTLDSSVPLSAPTEAPWCFLNARLLVSGDLVPPPVGSLWKTASSVLAATLPAEQGRPFADGPFDQERLLAEWLAAMRPEPPPPGVRLIDYPWDLIEANSTELRRGFVGGTIAGHVDPRAYLINESQIHVGAGAIVKPGVVLDAEQGPIWIDADARIEANAVLEGPCCIGRGSIVRPGAVIRQDTSIGPVCRVGGEIESSVFQGYANKQHDGFLGHTFVASWVNLGADTVTSDLKNTYGTIRVPVNGVPVESGRQFVGATIGDHAKTAIGTLLPTGCVIGVCANVLTNGASPRFVPSFAWQTATAVEPVRYDKAVEIARIVMRRRGIELTASDEAALRCAYERSRDIERPGWSAAS